MDTSNYTYINHTPCSIGPYWDPAGEYGLQSDIYTLLVYTPPRPAPRYLPKFIMRKPVIASSHHVIRSTQDSPHYDSFEHIDLCDMKTKKIKIKALYFPCDLRCSHVDAGSGKKCDEGCYVLEKGGNVSRWLCKQSDCEGHVYIGKVKKGDDGVSCFGKKGERLVCVEK